MDEDGEHGYRVKEFLNLLRGNAGTRWWYFTCVRSSGGAFSPTAMTTDIRKLVTAMPFVPFTIHLADRGQLRMPTIGHIAVGPAGGRVIVFGDGDQHEVICPRMITRITVDRQSEKAEVPN